MKKTKQALLKPDKIAIEGDWAAGFKFDRIPRRMPVRFAIVMIDGWPHEKTTYSDGTTLSSPCYGYAKGTSPALARLLKGTK